MAAPTKIKVLGIAGSLRSGSYNNALLLAARELAPDGMEISIYDDLGSIPPYNSDVEAKGDPEPVAILKKAIRDADALLIATPEYNYGIPGILKNAIDWASRPFGKSVLIKKPAAIMGATMGMGGTIRAQDALRQVFRATQTYLPSQPEVFVVRAQDKFDAKGHLTDDTTRTIIRQLLTALAELNLRMRQKG